MGDTVWLSVSETVLQYESRLPDSNPFRKWQQATVWFLLCRLFCNTGFGVSEDLKHESFFMKRCSLTFLKTAEPYQVGLNKLMPICSTLIYSNCSPVRIRSGPVFESQITFFLRIRIRPYILEIRTGVLLEFNNILLH